MLCANKYFVASITSTEGLILNGILTTARSQYSHFRTPENNSKQGVFSYFQGVQNGNTGQEWVKYTFKIFDNL